MAPDTSPDIVRAAYAELIVTDLGEARRFWVDLLGFVVSSRHQGRAVPARVRRADPPQPDPAAGPRTRAAARLAYRVRTAADLGLAEAFFAALGSRTARVPAGATPGVGEAVRAEDPLGFTVEFFCDAIYVERLQQRYDLRRGAEPARLDHFNIVVPDVRAAYEYYTLPGLRPVRDDRRRAQRCTPPGCSASRPCTTWRSQAERGRACTTWGSSPTSRTRCCGSATSSAPCGEKFLIERGPGRHGVSNAFYVYLRDPDGHRVEIYTSDYYTGDPGHPVLRWSVRDPRRRDFWGHPVIPSWYTEATAVLDLDGRPRPLRAEKQTAEVSAAEVRVGADGYTW